MQLPIIRKVCQRPGECEGGREPTFCLLGGKCFEVELP
jgi:hypothetical protein